MDWTHFLSKLGRETKWRTFWCYFRNFVRAEKISYLPKTQKFFAEVFRITRKHVLVKKKLGSWMHIEETKRERSLHEFDEHL